MYSPELLDHFQNPRNAGEVEKPDAVAQVENPACGDVLRLSAKVVDEGLLEIRFKAQGCVAAMACGSAITELASGKTLPQAGALRREDVIKAVGGLPEASFHASHLAIDALSAVLRQLGVGP
jgi:NifU-like protein involved in Fe-S cluster formation